jgi:hypothetical protein
MSTHEDLSRAHDVRGGSDRSFGFVFTVAFGVLGLWPRVHHHPIRIWWLAAGAAVLAVTLVKASWLGPANRLWTRFGGLLNRIVSPALSGLVFYLAVTPMALVMRWKGKDPLRLRWDPKAASYWLPREPPGPEPATMVHQF